MSNVLELSAGMHASIRQLAEETGFDRDTVQKKISENSVVPSGKRGGHAVYRIRDVLPALYVNGPDGREDPEKLDPFRRKAHYQAEMGRLQLQQETRELIPRIEVEQEQARNFRIVALLLDTLPDVLERDCGVSAELIARIEQAIDRCRESLYAELVGEDEPVRDSA